MKKIFTLFMALAMIFSLAGCGSGKEEPAKEAQKEEEPQYKSEDYINLMQTDKYYMESSVAMWGMKGDSIQAVDGENSYYKTDIMGMTTVQITLGDVSYILDETSKTYYIEELSVEEAEVVEESDETEEDYENMELYDFDKIAFTSSGTGVVPEDESGKEYFYEEFSIPYDFGDLEAEDEEKAEDKENEEVAGNITLRYYLQEDGKLYAIVTSMMGFDSVMFIHVLTDEIPEGLFDIPEGYTETDGPVYSLQGFEGLEGLEGLEGIEETEE